MMAARPERLVDPNPSSDVLETLVPVSAFAPPEMYTQSVPTAFGSALHQLHPEISDRLASGMSSARASAPLEDRQEGLASAPPHRAGSRPGGQKRRASSSSRKPPSKRPRLKLAQLAVVPPQASKSETVLLAYTQSQWILSPPQDETQSEGEVAALEVMAREQIRWPVIVSSSAVDKGSISNDEGRNPRAELLSKDQLHLYTLLPRQPSSAPTKGTEETTPQNVDLDTSFLISLPLVNTQVAAQGPYPGSTSGSWLLPVSRLAQSQHIYAHTFVKIESISPDPSCRNHTERIDTLSSSTMKEPPDSPTHRDIPALFRLILEVRISLAPSAFAPSYTAHVARDFLDLLRFISTVSYTCKHSHNQRYSHHASSRETSFPSRARTFSDFVAQLQRQQESLRDTPPTASTVYEALRPLTLPESGPKRQEENSWKADEGGLGVHTGFDPVLLPYQQRAVRFLLGREGKQIKHVASGGIAGSKSCTQLHADEQSELLSRRVGTDLDPEKRVHTRDGPQGDNSRVTRSVDIDSGPIDQKPIIMTTFGFEDLGMWWERVPLGSLGERVLFFNTVYGCFTFDPAVAAKGNVQASILAEEMGLGKTVELLALIMWNPASQEWTGHGPHFSSRLEALVTPSKATLIVVPETLRDQWMDEVQRHTPGLRAYLFESTAKAERDAVAHGYQAVDHANGQTIRAWDAYAKDLDVVVTSFHRLSAEVYMAMADRPRSRRAERKYPRPRSGLVTVGWWRVAVDEIQLLGGASNAFTTASMLPRCMGVCVSGTPVQSINDLGACLTFLRVPGLAPLDDFLTGTHHFSSEFSQGVHNAVAWILDRRMKPQLIRLLACIGVRHTKRDVQGELVLPPQSRALMPVELTRIERTFYMDTWAKGLLRTPLNIFHLHLSRY